MVRMYSATKIFELGYTHLATTIIRAHTPKENMLHVHPKLRDPKCWDGIAASYIRCLAAIAHVQGKCCAHPSYANPKMLELNSDTRSPTSHYHHTCQRETCGARTQVARPEPLKWRSDTMSVTSHYYYTRPRENVTHNVPNYTTQTVERSCGTRVRHLLTTTWYMSHVKEKMLRALPSYTARNVRAE
jgi:hypothetical protein